MSNFLGFLSKMSRSTILSVVGEDGSHSAVGDAHADGGSRLYEPSSNRRDIRPSLCADPREEARAHTTTPPPLFCVEGFSPEKSTIEKGFTPSISALTGPLPREMPQKSVRESGGEQTRYTTPSSGSETDPEIPRRSPRKLTSLSVGERDRIHALAPPDLMTTRSSGRNRESSQNPSGSEQRQVSHYAVTTLDWHKSCKADIQEDILHWYFEAAYAPGTFDIFLLPTLHGV